MKSQNRLITGCLVSAVAGVAIGMLIAPAGSEKFRKRVKSFIADAGTGAGEKPGSNEGGSTATTTFSNHG